MAACFYFDFVVQNEPFAMGMLGSFAEADDWRDGKDLGKKYREHFKSRRKRLVDANYNYLIS